MSLLSDQDRLMRAFENCNGISEKILVKTESATSSQTVSDKSLPEVTQQTPVGAMELFRQSVTEEEKSFKVPEVAEDVSQAPKQKEEQVHKEENSGSQCVFFF